MAIDTAGKRSSCLDYEEVWTAGIPLPDGSVSQADRQHLLWSYSGILVSPVAVSVPGLATLLDVARTAAGLSDARVGDVTLEDNAE